MKNMIDKILQNIPEETKKLIQKQGDLSVKVDEIMKTKKITIKELSKKTNISKSRLNKILSGQANLTLKTIIKLEVVLKEEIINI